MRSVTFWPGIGGGTEQYRCRVPGAGLERAGWQVRYVDDEDTDLLADVVVLQRVVHPAVVDAIHTLKAAGCTVVYDIDDWYDGIPTYNPASQGVTDDTLRTLHDALRAVDVVTCSTPELAEGYGHLNRTVVLPNYLDPDLWGDAHRYRRPRFKTHVGWMGAASYRSADLALLRDWLGDFIRSRNDLEFVVAGSDRTVFDMLGVGGKICPPARDHVRPYEHLPAMLAWFDIGLVPLAHNRFNDAKSWCKGMEYNAAGAVVVASPSREYRTYVQPGVNGVLVRKNDWVTALRYTLAHLNELREGAKRTAREHLIDRHIHRWVDAYTSVHVAA